MTRTCKLLLLITGVTMLDVHLIFFLLVLSTLRIIFSLWQDRDSFSQFITSFKTLSSIFKINESDIVSVFVLVVDTFNITIYMLFMLVNEENRTKI